MDTQASNREADPKGHDLFRGMGILIWIVPIIILSIAASVGGVYALLLWPVLLVFMGAACLVNAKRCGRLHCFFTGPFFLILAGISLLYGFGLLPLGPHGWQWLTDALLIGVCVLCCVPEWLLGKYVVRPYRNNS